jgi:hypothetical protein
MGWMKVLCLSTVFILWSVSSRMDYIVQTQGDKLHLIEWKTEGLKKNYNKTCIVDI